MVDTVGKRGQPGQKLHNVISVAMLSEGWDAANVTHIMGLRAFTSQLLCEQVIGRGLRRVAHDMDEQGLFLPEYVNIFGVPLSIFQDVGEEGEAPPPPKPSVRIQVEPGRNHLEIRWLNIQRIDAVLKQELVMDWENVQPLALEIRRSMRKWRHHSPGLRIYRWHPKFIWKKPWMILGCKILFSVLPESCIYKVRIASAATSNFSRCN